MYILVAAVVFVGALALLNLVFTVGVIRRLREHAERLAEGGGGHAHGGPDGLAVGDEPGEFETRTVDGTTLRRSDLADGALLGFFSPGCQPCREMLPRFVDHLRATPGALAVAVVVAEEDGDEADSFVAELRPVCPVVVERRGAALTGAFQVGAFPTVLRVGHDAQARLVVTDDVAELSLTEPAPTP